MCALCAHLVSSPTLSNQPQHQPSAGLASPAKPSPAQRPGQPAQAKPSTAQPSQPASQAPQKTNCTKFDQSCSVKMA